MGKNDPKKRKAPPSPNSSESSLMSIPSTTDQSSTVNEVKLNKKANENINQYRNRMKQATESRKRVQPSTSKAGRSPSKTREPNRQKNGVASKPGKAQVDNSSDDSVDNDNANGSSDLSALDKLSQKELAAKFRKKYAKKLDVSAEVPRLKQKESDGDWKAKGFRINRRDVMEKVRLEPELMRRPQPTKRPAPSTVPSEPASNQSKKQKTPELQNDSIIPLAGMPDGLNEGDSQDLEGPISSTPHPYRSNRNAESVPFSPVRNVNTNELQKHLIVTGKTKSGVSRRHKTLDLDYSSHSSVFSESQETQAEKSSVSQSILMASGLSTRAKRKNAAPEEHVMEEELSMGAAIVDVPQPLTPSKLTENAARSTHEESHEKPQEVPSMGTSPVNSPLPLTPSKRRANATRPTSENSSEIQQQIASVSASPVNAPQLLTPSKRRANATRPTRENSSEIQQQIASVSASPVNAPQLLTPSKRRANATRPTRENSSEIHQQKTSVSASVVNVPPTSPPLERKTNETLSIHEESPGKQTGVLPAAASLTLDPSTRRSKPSQQNRKDSQESHPETSTAIKSASKPSLNKPAPKQKPTTTNANNTKSPKKSAVVSSELDQSQDSANPTRRSKRTQSNAEKSPEREHEKSIVGSSSINDTSNSGLSKRIAIVLQPLSPSKISASVASTIRKNSSERQQKIASVSVPDVNISQTSSPSKRKTNETLTIRDKSPGMHTDVSPMAALNAGSSTRRSKQPQPNSKDSQKRHSETSTTTRSAVNPLPNSTSSKSPLKSLVGTSVKSQSSANSTRRSKRTQSNAEKSPERQTKKSLVGSSDVNKPDNSTFSNRGSKSKHVNAVKSPEPQSEKYSVSTSIGSEPQPLTPSKRRANVTRTIRENSSEMQQHILSMGTSGVNIPHTHTPSKRKTNETHTIREESPEALTGSTSLTALNSGPAARRSKPSQKNRKDSQEESHTRTSTAIRSVSNPPLNAPPPKQKRTRTNANAIKSPKKSAGGSPVVNPSQNSAVSTRRSKRTRSNAEKSPEKQIEKPQVGSSNVTKPSVSAFSKRGLRSKDAGVEKSPEKQPEISSVDTGRNDSPNYDLPQRRSKPTQPNAKESKKRLENAPKNNSASSQRLNRGDSEKEKLSSQASTSSLSQSQSVRVKRQSIFQTARDNKAKKQKTTPQPNVTRYVGNDVFGNYHMVKIEDFKIILKRTQPNHKLNEEQTKNLCVRMNHWLEDVFVDLCENTEQPYGFVTFQQLKESAMNQALLPDDVSDEDLMLTMKRIFSRADWKRSESILFPSRYTQRKDTDDYYFRD